MYIYITIICVYRYIFLPRHIYIYTEEQGMKLQLQRYERASKLADLAEVFIEGVLTFVYLKIPRIPSSACSSEG